MFKVACCDDEQGMLDILYEYIHRWSVERRVATTVTLFSDALELFREFECENKPQVLLMDIGFGDVSGFDVAKMIRDRNKALVLVFVTGTAQYAVDGYHIDAFRYLLKPVSYEMLANMLDGAYAKVCAYEKDIVMLYTTAGIVSVRTDDIAYIESIPHYIIAHLANGEKHKCKSTIRELEQRLRDSNLLKCHRAFLVNVQHIHMVQSDAIVLKNGERVPLSRNMKKSVSSQLLLKARVSS